MIEKGRRFRVVGLVAAVLIVLFGIALPAWTRSARDNHPNRPVPAPVPGVRVSPVASLALAPSLAAGADLSLSGSSTAAPSSVGIPTVVDIPAIGVHATIVSLGLDPNGTVQVPDRFDVAGWYSGGSRPGDPGPAVILGHVDSFKGPAVFFRLRDLRAGDTVIVTSATGPQRFHVDSVETYPKTGFPTAQVYGPVPDRALRLVTCGGSFNDSLHSYNDNVIVFATAV